MEWEEILKNLEYMHHHNEHHLEEMAEMAAAVDGKTKQLIEESIRMIKEGNDKLGEAIVSYKE